MRNRHKGAIALTATLLLAGLILGLGYEAIAIGGEELLKVSQAPEKVEFSGDISRLFSLRIEDDVQLYPWNLYEPGNSVEKWENVWPDLEVADLELAVCTLISLSANVEVQEARRWYSGQDRRVSDGLELFYEEELRQYLGFCQEDIRLNGREYQLKYCLIREEGGSYPRIYSFSCIRKRGTDVRDSQEWSDNKERFLSWSQKHGDSLAETWYLAYEMMMPTATIYYDEFRWEDLLAGYQAASQELSGGGLELDGLNQNGLAYFYGVKNESMARNAPPEDLLKASERGKEAWGLESGQTAAATDGGTYDTEEANPFELQMVELKDCALLMSDQSTAMGLYYDVMEQRVVGFHFF